MHQWSTFQATRAQAAGFKNYGVRLADWLGVVDTDEPAKEAWAVEHLPPTIFVVTTARGRHRYYRLAADAAARFDAATLRLKSQMCSSRPAGGRTPWISSSAILSGK